MIFQSVQTDLLLKFRDPVVGASFYDIVVPDSVAECQVSKCKLTLMGFTTSTDALVAIGTVLRVDTEGRLVIHLENSGLQVPSPCGSGLGVEGRKVSGLPPLIFLVEVAEAWPGQKPGRHARRGAEPIGPPFGRGGLRMHFRHHLVEGV